MAAKDLFVCFYIVGFLASFCIGQWEQGWSAQWDRWPGNKEKPSDCSIENPWPCEPPFFPYDPIKVEVKDIGFVVGRSMIYYSDSRYINIFLGVPFAKPPVVEKRFRPPEDPGPGWDLGVREWDASYYRPACPQEIWELDKRYMDPRNISEDCLYLNIFRPNHTDRTPDQNQNYPVFVFVHGDDYKLGDAQLYPGHVLAKKEVLVVTFNYRLGALGFLSTEDDNASGNYGILDVLKVLEWVQKYIKGFGGDPGKVTLAGAGSGAGIVGLLIVSPKSRQYNGFKPYFHRAIMMSGSDFCEWSVVKPVWNMNAREYAKHLGQKVGCDPYYGLPIDKMVDCLRYKHFEEIINASTTIYKAYGSLAGPFGPVIDGNERQIWPTDPRYERYRGTKIGGVIPKDPEVLRAEKKFMDIPILAGVNKDGGAFIVDNITKDIIGLRMEEGMDPGTFRDILYNMVYKRRAFLRNVDETVNALEFEYTFWSRPDNKTAVRQNLIDLWSDLMYGWCVDAVLKSHASAVADIYNPPNYVYSYTFEYRSPYEVLPLWQGIPHGKDVEYLFGYPFINDTWGNITGIIPQQWEYHYNDRNISEFVQDMWANFTKYSIPTIEFTRNVSWFPLTLTNLSYLRIMEISYMDTNYRQNHFGFWRDYFPHLSAQWPITTTQQPTPRPLREFEVATWSMTCGAILLIFVIGALGITLWRRKRSPFERDYY